MINFNKMRWGIINLIIMTYTLLPVVWILSLSLKPNKELNDGYLIPRHITFDNYITIFKTDDFIYALFNSMFIALISTFISIVLGILTSYAIVRLKFPGRTIIARFSIIISMFPQISLVIPLFSIERYLNLFDTWFGLMLPYITFSLPLSIYILTSFFQEIPIEIDKSAKMDGANFISILRNILIPLLKPGIVTAFILVFIFCWNDFLFAKTLTASQNSMTVPVVLSLFTGSSTFEDPIGAISAAAIVITIPILAFVILFQKYIISGLTSGSVKG